MSRSFERSGLARLFLAGLALLLLTVLCGCAPGSVVTYNPNNSSINSVDFYYAFVNAYSGGYSALRVVPGNYTIINTFAGFHLIAGCSGAQRSSFELDFGGSTFVLTVGLRALLSPSVEPDAGICLSSASERWVLDHPMAAVISQQTPCPPDQLTHWTIPSWMCCACCTSMAEHCPPGDVPLAWHRLRCSEHIHMNFVMHGHVDSAEKLSCICTTAIPTSSAGLATTSIAAKGRAGCVLTGRKAMKHLQLLCR